MSQRDAEFKRDLLRDADTGWVMTADLLAGITTWGGIGWLLDRWLDTDPWLLAIGIMLGFAAGMYLVYRRADAQGKAEEAKRRNL